jgi:hypothetical protein
MFRKLPPALLFATTQIFAIAVPACALAADGPRGSPRKTIEIRAGDLAFVLPDNSRSPRVLSEIDSLFNLRDAPTFDAYDPAGKGVFRHRFEHPQ